MRIVLRTHGNPSEMLERVEGSRLSDVVPNLDGKTVSITRNGAILHDVHGGTQLNDGDVVMTVANKRLGAEVALTL